MQLHPHFANTVTKLELINTPSAGYFRPHCHQQSCDLPFSQPDLPHGIRSHQVALVSPTWPRCTSFCCQVQLRSCVCGHNKDSVLQYNVSSFIRTPPPNFILKFRNMNAGGRSMQALSFLRQFLHGPYPEADQ
jgi:hypothetical protein